MNARDYPPERVERYINALNEADTYAQLERRDDRMRFALAVMPVADAETDPVYKSGYDTGRMHAGADRVRVLLEAAELIEQAACDADFTEDPKFIAGLRTAVELLTRKAGEKSSREADATPRRCPVCRFPFEDCTCVGGA